MLNGNAFGFNWKGLYVTSLIDAHSSWRHRADEFSDTLKTTALFGQYALNKYRGHYYAKSQNLARTLRAVYDAVLKDYDLLLMPTLPIKATPLPSPGAPRIEIIQRAFEMLANAPFDVTGHPAMRVPCGMSDGLPGGDDADREALRRGVNLSRGVGVGEGGGLEGDESVGPLKRGRLCIISGTFQRVSFAAICWAMGRAQPGDSRWQSRWRQRDGASRERSITGWPRWASSAGATVSS